jgi:signal transduction histidine kinase
MKLVQKLTVALVLAICVLLAINSVVRVHREVASFEAHGIREHRSVGRALRSSVLAVFRTEGEKRALELVDEASRSHGRIRFRWIWLDRGPHLHASTEAITGAPEGEPLTVEDRDEAGEPTRFTYVRATPPTGRRGALELAESLAEERSYLRKTVVEAAVTAVLLALACALVSTLASIVLIGRPIRALVAKARRIGEGDFSQPIEIKGRDELALLAVEMNATADRLVAARARIETETAARIAAIEQLRHADRLSTLGKLASGIAHELGTPMNVIAGHADMIVAHEVEGEEAVESARIIKHFADKVAGIVRQFLDFARRRGPQRAEHDLCKLTSQTTDLLRAMAEERGVHLRSESPGPVFANVDPGQMQQAVTNLVVNALHAVPRGGTVEVTCDADADGVFVRVRDDGPGIPAQDLGKVFDPFFTTKAAGEGTGLGLSVVQGIVTDHGGTIEVESEAGRGATFAIRLPRT